MSTAVESDASGRKIGRPADLGKRDAIIAAASDSFFDIGYEASSIEQIASQAGVSKVTVYNHFGDKRSLLAAAVERECAKMRDYFSIGATGQGSLRERLTLIGESMTAFLSQPKMVQFERRIAAETAQDPEIGLAFLAAGPHRMRHAFSTFLAALAATGELHIDDPELATEQFVGMCKGMSDVDRRFGHPVDPVRDKQRIDAAVDVFLRAYGAAPKVAE